MIGISIVLSFLKGRAPPKPPDPNDIPANAVLFNGEPLTFNGEVITYGD